MSTTTVIAINRFGLGARPAEPPPDDPKAWLLAQFDRFEPKPQALAGVPTRGAVVGEMASYFEELRRSKVGAVPAARRTPAKAPAAMRPDASEMAQAGLPDAARRYLRGSARASYLTMVEARANAALSTPAPFVERLTHFWANHFAVSTDKLTVIGLGGLLELEAIRPHVLGNFRDMLLAVERHPAMLLYLDQAQSVGPDAPLLQRARGRRAGRAGLNENLAREILELHTLGVDGGYTQADVTEFARALTGWTVAGLGRGAGARLIGLNGPTGEFQFVDLVHEPGPRRLLGRTYAQAGEAQGVAVLSDLAAHPATARHLATKLARHFAGDAPPPALVARLEDAYRRSGGDLPTVYRALIEAPEPWSTVTAKFKTPWDWSVSTLRALGTQHVEGQATAALLQQLGQPVWRPGSPAGWDDLAASWAGPDALVRRVEVAQRFANRTDDRIDPRRLATELAPDGLSEQTARSIAAAESRSQGLALLLVAPEFLRR